MPDFSSRFLTCLPFVLKEEGGYSNTPGDHGGEEIVV
jgi:lysozyme family protein